jgi:folate-binding protein YgfZ
MVSPTEYNAARSAAILLGPASRGRILVSGADRRSYLNAMLTNDVAALSAGQGCYAAYLTPQGRMIADMRVLDIGDLLLLDLPMSVKDTVLSKLDQFIFSEDVRLGDVTATISQVGLHGPAAPAVVRSVLERAGIEAGDADLDAIPEYASFRRTFQGEPLIFAASRELSNSGFDVYVGRPAAEAITGLMLEGGAVAAGEETAEVLRVERGRPLFGRDMDEDTIPLEAGIEQRAISFTKGCYPGQEVIVRVVHRGGGRVARKLVGLTLDSEVPVPAGSRVEGGGRTDGRVTSSVFSPAAGKAIALAYVHRDLAAAGTELMVLAEPSGARAKVTSLPFEGVSTG